MTSSASIAAAVKSGEGVAVAKAQRYVHAVSISEATNTAPPAQTKIRSRDLLIPIL